MDFGLGGGGGGGGGGGLAYCVSVLLSAVYCHGYSKLILVHGAIFYWETFIFGGHKGVPIHWTGLLDWTTGLKIYPCAKSHIYNHQVSPQLKQSLWGIRTFILYSATCYSGHPSAPNQLQGCIREVACLIKGGFNHGVNVSHLRP